MGSRRFFCFLPPPSRRLVYSAITEKLLTNGMAFDTAAFAFSAFEHGMPVASHHEKLAHPSHERILELAAQFPYVQTTCSNRHLSMTLSLGSPHPTPLATLSLSRRLWFGLAKADREHYENLFVDIAETSGATNILIIDDPPDDFLTGLEPIDDRWMIDIQLPRGGSLPPNAVLSSRTRESRPCTPTFRPTGRHVGNFEELIATEASRGN